MPTGVVVALTVRSHFRRSPRGKGDAVLDNARETQVVPADLETDRRGGGGYRAQLRRVGRSRRHGLGGVHVGGGGTATTDVRERELRAAAARCG